MTLTRLLDGNLLVALVVPEHAHHAAAHRWFGGPTPDQPRQFATCPTVQGTLLRLLVRQGTGVGLALRALRGVTSHPWHEQWLDDLTYDQVEMAQVIGHRQVTDAYLAQLARQRGARVATLDRGLAVAAPDVAELVPTGGSRVT